MRHAPTPHSHTRTPARDTCRNDGRRREFAPVSLSVHHKWTHRQNTCKTIFAKPKQKTTLQRHSLPKLHLLLALDSPEICMRLVHVRPFGCCPCRFGTGRPRWNRARYHSDSTLATCSIFTCAGPGIVESPLRCHPFARNEDEVLETSPTLTTSIVCCKASIHNTFQKKIKVYSTTNVLGRLPKSRILASWSPWTLLITRHLDAPHGPDAPDVPDTRTPKTHRTSRPRCRDPVAPDTDTHADFVLPLIFVKISMTMA